MNRSLTRRRDLSSREGVRFEVAECEILELHAQPSDPQPVGDRGVDLPRLLGDPLTLLRRQVLQRAHVVQPVSQLDQDDADVIHHGQDHLAQVLRLGLRLAREFQLADLGDARDDVRHFRAEVLLDVAGRRQCVLDDIVEQAGDDAVRVQIEVGQYIGDLDGVHEVRFARPANLVAVLARREDVGAPEPVEVGFGVVLLDSVEDVFEAPDHRR